MLPHIMQERSESKGITDFGRSRSPSEEGGMAAAQAAAFAAEARELQGMEQVAEPRVETPQEALK